MLHPKLMGHDMRVMISAGASCAYITTFLKTHATWIVMFGTGGALKAQGTVSSLRWVSSVHTPTRVPQEYKIVALLMPGGWMCIDFGVPSCTSRQIAWRWANTCAYGHTCGASKSAAWGFHRVNATNVKVPRPATANESVDDTCQFTSKMWCIMIAMMNWFHSYLHQDMHIYIYIYWIFEFVIFFICSVRVSISLNALVKRTNKYIKMVEATSLVALNLSLTMRR